MNTTPAKHIRLSYLHDDNIASPTKKARSTPQQQVDGSGDYHHQDRRSDVTYDLLQPSLPRAYTQQQHPARHHRAHDHIPSYTSPRKTDSIPKRAVTDILPYCTTEPPLKQEQVIALSDVVGSIKELVILALSAAAGEAGCVEKLERAVGSGAAGNIVEFFSEEWEVD